MLPVSHLLERAWAALHVHAPCLAQLNDQMLGDGSLADESSLHDAEQESDALWRVARA